MKFYEGTLPMRGSRKLDLIKISCNMFLCGRVFLLTLNKESVQAGPGGGGGGKSNIIVGMETGIEFLI